MARLTSLGLVARGLRHYWKWHLSLVLGVAVAAMILSGSFLVGDSVEGTLRDLGDQRIGKAATALVGGDRFVTDELVTAVENAFGTGRAARLLVVRGTVANQDGSRRANEVNILGVDEGFWEFSRRGAPPDGWEEGRTVALNDALAARLETEVGESVLVRMEVPTALSRDAPLSGSTEDSETTRTVRAPVAAVVAPESGGRFSLRNEQTAPLNVFLPLDFLRGRLEQEGSNLVLFGGPAREVSTALESSWTLADAALKLRPVSDGAEWELSTDRVFLDETTVSGTGEVLRRAPQGVLTYLVNRLRRGGGEVEENGDRPDAAGGVFTPYSMVAAVDASRRTLFGEGIADDEVLVTEWLAEDLGLAEGDSLEMDYFVSGPGRTLEERTARFSVRRILPMDHPEVAPEWTPDFPGVSDSDNCRDWNPGFDLDEDAIRDKDEEYWDEWKTTPKAFLSLAAGQAMWANRFGDLTSLRFPAGQITEEAFSRQLRDAVAFEEFGFVVADLRAQASAAVGEGIDFGGLFASMGFFLVVSALVLAGLLFAFGIEKRSDQIGLLMAVGFPARRVRRLFLVEALLLAALGALVGIGLGVLYTKAALWALSSEWAGAVAGVEVAFHAGAGSLVLGWGLTVALAVGVAWLVTRRVAMADPTRLLAGGKLTAERRRRGPEAAGGTEAGAGSRVVRTARRRFQFALGALVFGIVLVALSGAAGASAKPGLFFGAGALILAAGLFVVSGVLARLRGEGAPATGIQILGIRNSARRPGRSLVVAGVMAAGVFIIVAVNAFRLSAEQDARERSSGTGGFAFFASSALPVYEDLNSPSGRQAFGLEAEDLPDVHIVPIRESEGDDASCLNLNRAQNPRVIGVDPGELAARGAFTFAAVEGDPEGSPWLLLDRPIDPASAGSGAPGQGIVVPGIVDQNTALWALGKQLGDVIEYPGPSGAPARVRIVGLLANSMLQGRVIVGESQFVRLFPEAGGYRSFLIDAPESAREGVRSILTQQLGNRGLEVVPAEERLAAFNAVQNTYLSIFSTLGGFGVLLGTLGLAVVVARHVLERRGELGVLEAVGFRRRALRSLVVAEHWFLHVAGVLVGVVAALVAVWPSIAAPGSGARFDLIAALVLAVLVAGIAFCWLAAAVSLRRPLIEAIRHE